MLWKRPAWSTACTRSEVIHVPQRTGMSEKLDPEAKRLRHVSSGELADEIGALEARVGFRKNGTPALAH